MGILHVGECNYTIPPKGRTPAKRGGQAAPSYSLPQVALSRAAAHSCCLFQVASINEAACIKLGVNFTALVQQVRESLIPVRVQQRRRIGRKHADAHRDIIKGAYGVFIGTTNVLSDVRHKGIFVAVDSWVHLQTGAGDSRAKFLVGFEVFAFSEDRAGR